MRNITGIGVAAVAACLAACGGTGSPEPAAPAATPAAATVAAGAPASAPAAPARDVSALKACELVTPQEVATIVGGRLLNEPPAGFANCAYVVETTAGTESYRLVFAEPAMYAALLDTQSDAEKGERVAGLWDEAYVQPRVGGNGFTVIVIKRGELAVEASGDRREAVLEIARLAVARVP